MKSLVLQPISHIKGTVQLPGSKSISNRALLLAALVNCGNVTILDNLLDSDDVRYMINSLKKLGVCCTMINNRTTYKIIGTGGRFDYAKKQTLFLGNAGTVMRFLVAAVSLGKNNVILTGSKRMKQRPIGPLVDALCQNGASIEYLKNKHYPPLLLRGGFTGGEIIIDGCISSQFITALLMIAPLSLNNTIINIKGKLVSRPYVDITINLMSNFGVEVQNYSYQRFIIQGKQQYRSPGYFWIEGDASSASYFLAAAAIKGGTVKVIGIGKNSIQGDILFAKVLEKMGAIIYWGEDYITCTHNILNSIDMDMNHIPDSAMTAAIVALFARGVSILRNIHNWRIKETDRLFAMTTELRKVGAIVKNNEDNIEIIPPKLLHPAKIYTYNDHRIAMCFSLIALSGVSVTIINPKCITKTFPNYFELLKKISVLH